MGGICCKEENIDFDDEVHLNHFNLMRSVGRGSFGKVRVVQHKKTKEMYALKYINKAKCVKMRAIKNVISERRLLESLDYPFIVNLRYAFQDDVNLFMVIDLMLGGDLRFHLERMGKFPEECVRLYAAELSSALDFLHSKRVVHRDIKPDNVLLDSKGHVHLTDFNIAAHYNESKPLTTYAGSLAYMAPEILQRHGYLNSVDWWSLGAMLYEIVFGARPFRGRTSSALTNAIIHDPLLFPPDAHEVASQECIDFITRLCTREIPNRLGCGEEGFAAVKSHPWFKDLDWEAIKEKKVTPKFEPDSTQSNFDAMHELEELLLEDDPLTIRKKNKTRPIIGQPDSVLGRGFTNKYGLELKMLEEEYHPYNFTRVNEIARQQKRAHAVITSTGEGVDVVSPTLSLARKGRQFKGDFEQAAIARFRENESWNSFGSTEERDRDYEGDEKSSSTKVLSNHHLPSAKRLEELRTKELDGREFVRKVTNVRGRLEVGGGVCGSFDDGFELDSKERIAEDEEFTEKMVSLPTN
ncbi:uncharacterized protein VTP21DRAFT_1476 [Calcarisporiella thermophila]|uniref:uncharacterized protein n=1 Tax=Calcarisporiella thermophila TaxID=911321 RepID=UPI003742C4DD